MSPPHRTQQVFEHFDEIIIALDFRRKEGKGPLIRQISIPAIFFFLGFLKDKFYANSLR